MLTRSVLYVRHTPVEGVVHRVLVTLDVLSSLVVVTLCNEFLGQS